MSGIKITEDNADDFEDVYSSDSNGPEESKGAEKSNPFRATLKMGQARDCQPGEECKGG